MSSKPAKAIPYNSGFYLLKRLLTYHIRPQLKRLGLAVLCMIVVAGSTALQAYLMQPVIDDVFISRNADRLGWVAAAVLLVAIIKGAASYGQSFFMIFVTQRVITHMQMNLYRHLLHSDLSLISGEASGTLVSRFTTDFTILRSSINIMTVTFARELFSLIFLIGLMFYQSSSLAFVAFGAFPIAIYPILRLGKRMRKISVLTQQELGAFAGKLGESFQSASVIKAYQREDFEVNRASTVMERIFALYVKAARTYSAISPIMETLSGIAVAAIIWYGGLQVITGVTTPGKFFSFVTAALMAYKPLKSLSSLNNTLQEGLAAAKRLFELMDTQPRIIDRPDAKILKPTGGGLRFENVSFSYSPKKPALRGVSFEVPHGKTIALVGPSGGGKSTIMNLILRFYDVDSGAIRIGGHDIRDVTLDSLRSNIALVSQHITLFDDTIRANIAYGDTEASDDVIYQAAKAAAADDFIRELNEGYDTLIGQNGLTLSGGQRQRISIARAMLRNAPILLLDEATSALDSISEKHIQRALERLMQGRTTIVIAHRLTTVENADLIYVLKRGKIVESGTHSELLAQGGEYLNLYKGLE